MLTETRDIVGGNFSVLPETGKNASRDSQALPPTVRTLSIANAHWARIQYITLTSGVALVATLIFWPSVGINLFWNGLIPLAPALIVLAPGLWRNICPMATFSLLPRRLGLSQRKIMSKRTSSMLTLASVIALVMIVPWRHVSLNTNGAMTALMLVFASLAAFSLGMRFEWRSGWCTSLCPIHPVEKLYGISPAVTFNNARCGQCKKCSSPCPDSVRSMSPIITGPASIDKVLGKIMVGGFAGFIWGWYQIPDYSGTIGTEEIVSAYLWPFGSGLVSLAAYMAIQRWAGHSKRVQAALVKFFAAMAVSTYYWYRIPALVGLGPHHGTGMVYDLNGVLPEWVSIISHVVTSVFFIWFLVIRRSSNASWMERPALVQQRTIRPASTMD